MEHQYEKEIKAALETYIAANNKVKKLLSAGDLATAYTYLESRTTQQVNLLNGLLGVAHGGYTPAEATALKPLTHFFGEELEIKKPISKTDIIPNANEKEVFMKQRDELYAEIPNLTDVEILSKVGIPGWEPLIRSCAKKAGVTDFRTAKIDVVLLDRIREGIAKEATSEGELKKAETQLKQLNQKNDAKKK